jgi:Mor family transcriptional regulator
MRHGRDPWEALRVDYVRIVQECTGATPDVSMRAAAELVRAFRVKFGGADLYVPRPARYDEAALLREFDGRNVDEVCTKHGIAHSTLYRAVARARNRGEKVASFSLPPPSPVPPEPAPLRHPGKSDHFEW